LYDTATAIHVKVGDFLCHVFDKPTDQMPGELTMAIDDQATMEKIRGVTDDATGRIFNFRIYLKQDKRLLPCCERIAVIRTESALCACCSHRRLRSSKFVFVGNAPRYYSRQGVEIDRVFRVAVESGVPALCEVLARDGRFPPIQAAGNVVKLALQRVKLDRDRLVRHGWHGNGPRAIDELLTLLMIDAALTPIDP
jgi:hypothetical protein